MIEIEERKVWRSTSDILMPSMAIALPGSVILIRSNVYRRVEKPASRSPMMPIFWPAWASNDTLLRIGS